MPQRAAMSKHLRQTKTRTNRNRLRKDAAKQATRQALDAARGGDAEAAQTTLQAAQKAIDKAAQRGVLHKSNAARRKSSLAQQVRALLGE